MRWRTQACAATRLPSPEVQTTACPAPAQSLSPVSSAERPSRHLAIGLRARWSLNPTAARPSAASPGAA
eukprot:15459047-Alexandrium_andersonii.AAC.1